MKLILFILLNILSISAFAIEINSPDKSTDFLNEIVSPDDVISYGQMEWSESTDTFDLLNYSNFKYLVNAGSIKNNFTELNPHCKTF